MGDPPPASGRGPEALPVGVHGSRFHSDTPPSPQSQVLGAAGIPKAFLTRDPCLADPAAEGKPVSGEAAGDVPGFFLLIVNGFFLKTLVRMFPFKWQK